MRPGITCSGTYITLSEEEKSKENSVRLCVAYIGTKRFCSCVCVFCVARFCVRVCGALLSLFHVCGAFRFSRENHGAFLFWKRILALLQLLDEGRYVVWCFSFSPSFSAFFSGYCEAGPPKTTVFFLLPCEATMFSDRNFVCQSPLQKQRIA